MVYIPTEDITMFKPIFALVVGTTLFSALFSTDQPIEVEPMQYVQQTPYRIANVLFSDGSFHEVEMKRPMFMSGSCQRSTTEAIPGEVWIGVDGPAYIYEGNNVWVPRREETKPPVQVVIEEPSSDSILDNVVIEPYIGEAIQGSQATCATCQQQTYRAAPVYRQRVLFPRLRGFFSRMRFGFRFRR